MFGADRGGDRVEMPHALDEPGQFVGGDFIGVGIAGLDIGALQLCEMAAGRARIPRPSIDQPGGSVFGGRAPDAEAVGIGRGARQARQQPPVYAPDGPVSPDSPAPRTPPAAAVPWASASVRAD